MSAVWERFPDGGLMLLALALADHAHDDGTRIWPAVNALAIKTRQSKRTIQYQLRKLETMGWLLLVRESTGQKGDTRDYRICPKWLAGGDLPVGVVTGADIAPPPTGAESDTEQASTGATDDGTGATAVAPKPSINHQEQEQPPSTRQRATNRCHASHILPSWIPLVPWERWLAMRALKRAYMTGDAIALAFTTLAKLRKEGDSPEDVLDQSTLCGWTGLFHVKPGAKRDTSSSNAAAAAEFVAQLERDQQHGGAR